MEHTMKADAFARHLEDMKNGFEREDYEQGVLFTFTDANGITFGVSFPREGEVQAATVACAAASYPQDSDELMLRLLNRHNTRMTLCKAYRDEAGAVWLKSALYETGAFLPEQVMSLLVALGRQAGPLIQAVRQVIGQTDERGQGDVC